MCAYEAVIAFSAIASPVAVITMWLFAFLVTTIPVLPENANTGVSAKVNCPDSDIEAVVKPPPPPSAPVPNSNTVLFLFFE